jgi:flagellar protein FliO/FliZ
MLDALFGVDMPSAAKFILAFVIVLALIGGTAWAVRRFGSSRLSAGSARGRQPRLAVIDSANVDGRRRLLLIRRDNVEHLLMIGGPTDVLVESSIMRGAPAQREMHGAPPVRISSEPLPRPVPPPEGTMWPLQPEPGAPPVRPPRQVAAAEEPVRWPSPPQPEPARAPQRQVDTLAGLADDLSTRPAPVRPEPRMAAPEPVVAKAEAELPAGEQNLAEMAQRLEAALRRPGQAETKPVAAAETKPAVAAEQRPAPAPKRGAKVSEEAPPVAAAAPAPEVKPPRGEAKGGKTRFDSLEQEMASLLGRAQEKG